jgi:hypothetical protein
MKNKFLLLFILFLPLLGFSQDRKFEAKIGLNKGTSPLDGGNPLGAVAYFDTPLKNKWSLGTGLSYLKSSTVDWFTAEGPGGFLEVPLSFKEQFFTIDAGIRYNLSPVDWRNQFRVGAGLGIAGMYLNYIQKLNISGYEVSSVEQEKGLAVYPLYHVFFEHNIRMMDHFLFFYRVNLSGRLKNKTLFTSRIAFENGSSEMSIYSGDHINLAVGFGYTF